MKIVFSYRYLIPVTEKQPEALYTFKSREFGGAVGVKIQGKNTGKPPTAVWGGYSNSF